MKKMSYFLGIIGIFLTIITTFAMENSKKEMTVRLPAKDPLSDYQPTSPRSLLGLLTPRSREDFNKKRKPEAGRMECILYYCLCLPLCYACCKPDEESYRAF